MKRIRLFAGMSFSGATHETEYEYSDEEFEDMSEEELYELADEFAQQYVEAWYEVVDD